MIKWGEGMNRIKFYRKKDGTSDVLDFLDDLRRRAGTNKDARIQFRQMTLYIDLLRKNGTNLSVDIVKHLDDDIWELRPGNNRVFFFYHKGDAYVLLHHFRKKTQETPPRELKRAKKERDDYIIQRGMEP